MMRPMMVAMMFALVAGCSSSGSEAGDTAATDTVSNAVADVRKFDLTMNHIDKLHQAQLNIGLAVKNMSDAEREAIRTSSGPNTTIDQMIQNIENNPPYNEAIRKADLTAREYTMIMLAMMQASAANSFLASRPQQDPDSLVRMMNVNPSNIRFMRDHYAEIGRKQEKINAEMKRLGIEE